MKNIKKLKKLLQVKSYRSLIGYMTGYKTSIALVTGLNSLLSLNNVVVAITTKTMIDYAVNGKEALAFRYAMLFALALACELLLNSFISYYNLNLVESMRNQFQVKVISSIYHKKWLEINEYKTGDLLTRIYDDVDNVVNVITKTIPSIVGLLIQLVLAFVVLSYYDPVLAIFTFLISPFFVLISMFVGTRLKEVQHKILNVEGTLRSLINESLQNLLILKAYKFLSNNVNEVEGLQSKRFYLLKRKNIIGIKANAILSTGYSVGYFAALALGAYRLLKKTISFGTYTAFVQLVGQVQGPVQVVSMQIPKLVAALSSVERLEEIDFMADEKDGHKISNAYPKAITLNNIEFSYKEEHVVLKNFSLYINQGEKVAIIGPSGSGKTTLIHIILAMLEPKNGNCQILFDNDKKIDVNSSTRALFAYVPQVNSLFSGSIRDNFLLENAVEEAEIEKALKTACAYDFIMELPEGIDTRLHERGIGISQGQAQRVAVVRALLHDAPILIFDEATSALDLFTEKQMVQNLKVNYPDKTLIAVTHRENILEICDRVIELI